MKTDYETNYLEATTMRLMREAGLCGYGEDGGQYTVPATAMISRIQRIVESAIQMGRSECIAEAQRLVWAIDNGGKPYRRPATAVPGGWQLFPPGVLEGLGTECAARFLEGYDMLEEADALQILLEYRLQHPAPERNGVTVPIDEYQKIRRGAHVATKVWEWLHSKKRVQFVPWVTETTSPHYDPVKAAKQEEKDRLLSELEEVIGYASPGAAHPAPPAVPEWQPIDTAPKDGDHVQLYRPDIQFVGYWAGDTWGWCHNAPGLGEIWPAPTHWKPLSAAPPLT